MLHAKADLVVVNLDPRYPQESIDAMCAHLDITYVIDGVDDMKPIDLVLRKRSNGRQVSTHDARRAFADMRSLMVRVFTEASKQPTKQLVVLVPRYMHRSKIAALPGLQANADEVVCTGSN